MESQCDVNKKDIRVRCAHVLSLNENDCIQLMAQIMWTNNTILRYFLSTLHTIEDSPNAVIQVLFTSNVYLSMMCDLECNGTIEYPEWDIILYPFGNKKGWIRIHEVCLEFRQCIQLLISKRSFTIKEKNLYGTTMWYHSFRNNHTVNLAFKRELKNIMNLYFTMLEESNYPDYEMQELRDSIQMK